MCGLALSEDQPKFDAGARAITYQMTGPDSARTGKCSFSAGQKLTVHSTDAKVRKGFASNIPAWRVDSDLNQTSLIERDAQWSGHAIEAGAICACPMEPAAIEVTPSNSIFHLDKQRSD